MRTGLALVLIVTPVVSRADGPRPMSDAVDRTRMAMLEESEGLEEQITRTRDRLRQRVRSVYRLLRAGSGRGGGSSALENRVRSELARRALAADLRDLRAAMRRAQALDELRERVRRDAASAEAAPVTAAPAGLVPPALPEPPPVFTIPGRPGSLVLVGEPSAAFGSLRGRLGLPVRGTPALEVRRRDGGPVELGVGAAAIAQAVAPGRVDFAGDYAGFAKMVIVDHGGRYHTLTGGLVTVSVGRGQAVQAGDALGVGAGTVVFEIRQAGRTLDALAWLGLGTTR